VQPSVIGLFVGLILGLILEIDGFGAMVVTAVIGLIGFVVGKVLQGEIDLGELIDRTRRQQQ
jgi:uncharacterized membrane protein YeaQ/YmgE (transglycosylase-associated protein family)